MIVRQGFGILPETKTSPSKIMSRYLNEGSEPTVHMLLIRNLG